MTQLRVYLRSWGMKLMAHTPVRWMFRLVLLSSREIRSIECSPVTMYGKQSEYGPRFVCPVCATVLTSTTGIGKKLEV
jgi:hypothetical protein